MQSVQQDETSSLSEVDSGEELVSPTLCETIRTIFKTATTAIRRLQDETTVSDNIIVDEAVNPLVANLQDEFTNEQQAEEISE